MSPLVGIRLSPRASGNSAITATGKKPSAITLVLAASRLRRCVADVDMAARVGEHQFALLLEGPTTDVVAQDCATRVVASGLRESEALPAGVTLRFHVAVAMLPDDRRDAAGSLQWLLALVNDMAQDQRKSIRTANF